MLPLASSVFGLHISKGTLFHRGVSCSSFIILPSSNYWLTRLPARPVLSSYGQTSLHTSSHGVASYNISHVSHISSGARPLAVSYSISGFRIETWYYRTRINQDHRLLPTLLFNPAVSKLCPFCFKHSTNCSRFPFRYPASNAAYEFEHARGLCTPNQ